MLSPNTHPPWECLVNDILQEIFILSVTGTEDYFGCLVFDGRRPSYHQLPQLSILQVCSTWRQVALLTPRLWNRIYIKDITNFNSLIATEWLSRARDVPISIKVDDLIWNTADEEHVRHSLLISILSPYRIQHLDIQSTTPISLHDLSARNVADLESLAVEHFAFRQGDIELNDDRYPNLSHLSLRGNCRLIGACDSLRKFDASKCYLTVSEVWGFLRGCPLLEECWASIKRDDRGRCPITTDLYLPSLRILRFAFRTDELEIPFASIIDPFTLPCLETFHIYNSSIHWSPPAFDALVMRSNGLPHLSTFALTRSRIMVEAGPLLALIPSVSTVFLCSSEASIGQAIFDEDALIRLASGSLGPRLKELVVGEITKSSRFMDMVESRMENAQECSDTAPASFTKVQFKTQDRYVYKYDRLNNMRQRGIPISVLTNNTKGGNLIL